MLKQKTGKIITQQNIIEKIRKYKVVSFDVFDTLVKRDCAESKKLFEMMEMNLVKDYPNFRDFSEKRINAEHYAREKRVREEVTLDEIYVELQGVYNDKEIEILQTTEIKYEKSLCQVSQHMMKVYKYCLDQEKIIILVSDMYLPVWVINDILKKLGIDGYQKLYLSSDLFLTKQTGHLYDYVIEDLGISAIEMVHLGDNWRSDVIEPRKRGISSVHINHNTYSNLIYNARRIINKEQQSDYQALSSFIDNRTENGTISDENYFHQAGYEMEGPLLVGFSKWLSHEIKTRGIKKLYFLSRDGQIMQKAYVSIFGNEVETQYIYASRRAYIVPTLWMYGSMEEMISAMFFPRIGSIGAFIKKIGLESEYYVDVVSKYGYDIEMKYIYSDLFNQDSFKNLYEEIKDDIHTNSRKEYEILLRYLQQIDFIGKIAIVDIGWHGNMQKALVKICINAGISVDIHGFYLGLNPNICFSEEEIKVFGFLFQADKNESYFELQRNFTSIFEMMFTADHGSVKKFTVFDSKVIPVFEPFEYVINGSWDDFDPVECMQKGALKFIDDVRKEPEFELKWLPSTVFQNMILLGNAPDFRSACKFGNIKQLGDKVTYIARPRKMISYISNPKCFMEDLADNPWKIGFFKRLCKIKLPYFEIYMTIRKAYVQWKKKQEI